MQDFNAVFSFVLLLLFVIFTNSTEKSSAVLPIAVFKRRIPVRMISMGSICSADVCAAAFFLSLYVPFSMADAISSISSFGASDNSPNFFLLMYVSQESIFFLGSVTK